MRRYLKALFAAAVLVLSSTSALAKGCLKAIKKFEPDILCLQEAYSYHKADLMKELNKYMLVDRSVKPGQVDPEVKNNENPIMFRGDKFELLDYGSFWLNEGQAPDTPGWDAAQPRNATWVKLRYKKSGVIFFCFNTRFDDGENAGKKSSELMADKVKEIAGDDAQTMATFNGFGKPGNAPLWPDHIHSRNAKVESYEVVDAKKYGPKFISDHNPVYAEFEIRIPKGK